MPRGKKKKIDAGEILPVEVEVTDEAVQAEVPVVETPELPIEEVVAEATPKTLKEILDSHPDLHSLSLKEKQKIEALVARGFTVGVTQEGRVVSVGRSIVRGGANTIRRLHLIKVVVNDLL